MSNARYIEIDSTYRNRNEWPNPAEFEILISQTGRKDMNNAQDPVSLAAPIGISWSPKTFNRNSNSGLIVTNVRSIGIQNQADQKTIITFNDNNPTYAFNIIDGYYNGVVLKNITESNSTTTVAGRISSFVYLSQTSATNNMFQITLDSTIKIKDGDEIQIADPTYLNTYSTGDTNFSYFFVPNGRSGVNAYTGYILYNKSIGLYSPILGYDPITKLIKVIVDPSIWTVDHIYSINKEAPIKLNPTPTIASGNHSSFSLDNTIFSDQQNFYKNSSILLNNGETRLITRYETFTGITNANAPDTTTIYFPENASNINGFYNNAYIQIGTESKKIINYTVSDNPPTRIASIDPSDPFSSVILKDTLFTFRTIFVDKLFTNTDAETIELLPFSHDNHNPFVYTGSMVSQQEAVCYQVELMDLILPNKILDCGFGSRIAFYPYLYVEITNISGSNTGMKNTIYSNNPNATSMIFRVPIYDVQNPIASAFVKLDGDGMVQTVKFKPNESIFFSVHLPNGELFKILEEEKYSPYSPNQDIQISALFSFKRV